MAAGVVWNVGAIWLAVALLLVGAEMLVPGFFLIFLGAGAGVTGLAALLLPMPAIAQALLFAAVTAAAVFAGRDWYRRPPASTEPLLNDRAARLIGQQVEVSEAIIGGQGRVRVGDGAWNASGPDAPVGTMVRIVGASGSVLHVAP